MIWIGYLQVTLTGTLHRAWYMCVHAQSLQLCLTLCNPVNCSPPGSSVHGILQARALEEFAMLSQPRDRTCISCLSCIASEFFTH